MLGASAPRDDKSFQVDVFVSFFAILIIVATALVGGLQATQPSVLSQDYRSLDTPSDPFALRGWRLVFAFNTLWIIRNGRLQRIDTVALAQAMAEDRHLFSSADADDFSRPLSESGDPGDLMLNLQLRTAVPPQLIAEDIAVDDPSTAERFAGRSYDNGADAPYFFVWSDQVPSAATLFTRLRDRGVPFRWRSVDAAKGRVQARRAAASYSLEEALR